MDKELRRILDETLLEVLEKLAFLFAEAASPEDTPDPEGDLYRAKISFAGKMSGSIELFATEETAYEIAANFLGVDEDSDDVKENAIDALKEILNVVCGNFLTAAAGDEVVFDLTVPEGEQAQSSDWELVLATTGVMTYNVDEQLMACQLELIS